ncbi:MAG: Fluorescence recovery protein [Chroococcopsis gigantea SAG 12.99]|jgi:hypothetical protein|nr:Fluorescence recovery protein [Chroococcopsis gigantea SAG 12.99]
MVVNETVWSENEQIIAANACYQAHDREVKNLIEEVRIRTGEIEEIEDLWRIHDFLSARRHQIDGKYDNRPSALLFVLAQLIKETLISIEELEGLNKDKLAKITALSKM